MSPTTLKALRQLLFFTAEEAARFIPADAVSEQQWRSWELGEQTVPENVKQRILELVDWRTTAQAAMADAIRQQMMEKGVPESILVIWYDRLEDWQSLPNREASVWRVQQSVCASLAAMFQTLRLVAFDANAYRQWRGGREDSESTRTEWASSRECPTQ